eukprot:3769454-Lingulodinium_polyedra.AAC.1
MRCLGRRLTKIAINMSGVVAWSSSGFFRILNAGAGNAKFQHVNGEEAPGWMDGVMMHAGKWHSKALRAEKTSTTSYQ